MRTPALLLCVMVSHPASGAPVGNDVDAACERGRAALEQLRTAHHFPGAVLSVIVADGTRCVVPVGFADIESQAPMRRDSRMLAASIGKTLVAAVTLRLEHEGLLSLDDPVSRWLGNEPYFKRLPNARGMTIRHLLSHTSGLPDHVHSEAFAKALAAMVGTDRHFTPKQLLGFVLDEPPLFEPGAKFAYSDTSYIVLGLVLEKAAKRSYYELAEQYFVRPLGLALTTPSTERALPGLVPGYLAEDNPLGLPKKSIEEDGRMNWNPASEWTGGGFVSNAGDLARWIWLEFSGRAAPYPYVEKLLESAPAAAKESGYGLGVRMFDSPVGRQHGHWGWIPGYVSAAYYLPSRRSAYALQINSDVDMAGPDGRFTQINDAVLAAVFKDPTVAR
jgi:D-alanyl-D-alanine carboxypeptidase